MTFVSKIEAHPTNTTDKAAYPPGTVAVATVRGVKGVRVLRRYTDVFGNPIRWDSAEPVDGVILHLDPDVTDVRPLVVLDLERYVTRELLVTWLRQNPVCGSYIVSSEIADQIEAQTKPPRIPEPGLWGVVEAHTASNGNPRRFARHADLDGLDWCEVGGAYAYRWDDLINPTLIREGINA